MSLDPQQQAAATATHPNILLRAGAGAGKTKTLVARVLHLMRNGVDPTEVLCLTFTRAASQEMAERIEEEAALLKLGRAHKVTVSTFHSWGANVLRGYGGGLIRSNFSIMDDDDVADVICYVAAELDPKFKLGETADGRKKQARSRKDKPGVWDRFLQHMRAAGALSFDMIEDYLRMLMADERVAAQLRSRWRHVLVDEFQDTSKGQQEVLRLFAPRNVFRVGDHAQSIYRFRGANVEEFVALTSDPSCEVLELQANYRSTSEVVRIANKIGDHMQVKGLIQSAERGEGLEVEGLECPDRQGLVKAIAVLVNDLADEYGLQNVAILAPQWRHLEDLADALTGLNLPIRFLRRTREVWDYEGARRIVALIKGLVNPHDHMSLWRALGSTGKVGLTTWNLIRLEATAAGSSFLEAAIRREGIMPGVLSHFTALGPDPAVVAESSISDAVNGLLPWLVDEYVGDARFTKREEVDAFASAVYTWEQEQASIGAPHSVAAFLDWHAGRHLVGEGKDPTELEPAVSLSTIHGAKGLEWKAVVGLVEEGYLPKGDLDGEALEESRRLFYVLTTRARDKLVFAAAGHHGFSRFVKEVSE